MGLIWSAIRYRAINSDKEYYDALYAVQKMRSGQINVGNAAEQIRLWLRAFKTRGVGKNEDLERKLIPIISAQNMNNAVETAFGCDSQTKTWLTTNAKVLHVLFPDNLAMWDDKIHSEWKIYHQCGHNNDLISCYRAFQEHVNEWCLKLDGEFRKSHSQSLKEFLNRHLYHEPWGTTLLRYIDEHFWIELTNQKRSPLELSVAKPVLEILLNEKRANNICDFNA